MMHRRLKPYQCSKREYKKQQENPKLKLHIKYIDEGKRPDSCPICKASFKHDSSFKKPYSNRS